MKGRGLYELLVTQALTDLLNQLPESLERVTQPLRSAEAADRIALHVRRVVQQVVQDITETHRVAEGLKLADDLLGHLGASRPDVIGEMLTGEVLHAIAGRLPDGSQEVVPHPLIPLLDTALLTNA